MIGAYGHLMEKAQKLLDICMKYREDLFYFLIDGPGFDLYTHDSYGENEYAVDVRMQAIYNKFKTCPNVKDLFEKTLIDVAENNKSGRYMTYALLLIEYQLRQERANDAPFKINAALILEQMRKNIAENYELLNRRHSAYPDGFIPILQMHSEILKNYGFSIM